MFDFLFPGMFSSNKHEKNRFGIFFTSAAVFSSQHLGDPLVAGTSKRPVNTSRLCWRRWGNGEIIALVMLFLNMNGFSRWIQDLSEYTQFTTVWFVRQEGCTTALAKILNTCVDSGTGSYLLSCSIVAWSNFVHDQATTMALHTGW